MSPPIIAKDTRTVVVYGLHDSEILRALKDQAPPSGRIHIIVDFIERDRRDLLKSWGLEELASDERFGFVTGLNAEEVSMFFMRAFHSREKVVGLAALEIFTDPQLEDAYVKKSTILQERLQREIPLMVSSFGYREDGLVGLRYLVKNLNWIKRTPGISHLKDIAKNVPAVIASTGPSLSRSLPLLKSIQDKALIISLDASLKILLKEAITPDLVCTLERDLMSKKFFEGLGPQTSHLVSFPVVPPEVIGTYEGKQWNAFRSYRQHFYFDKQLQHGFLECGHSVAHMAVALAKHMGCSPIVLVGQDLCFDPERLSSHPQNIAYSEWAQTQSQDELRAKLQTEGDDLYWLPGNLQAQVPTRGYYIVFARQLGLMASQMPNRLFNATDGGLKLPGVPWLSFDEAVASWKPLEERYFKILDKIHSCHLKENSISLEPFFQQVDLLQKRLQSDLEVAQLMKTPAVLQNMLKTWEVMKKDHVCEGFALEILGQSTMKAEMELLASLSKQAKVDDSIAICSKMFTELKDCLATSTSILKEARI